MKQKEDSNNWVPLYFFGFYFGPSFILYYKFKSNSVKSASIYVAFKIFLNTLNCQEYVKRKRFQHIKYHKHHMVGWNWRKQFHWSK